MFTRYTLCALLALGSALSAPASASAADPFAGQVEEANKKLVKLFGAGGFSRLNSSAPAGSPA
jgi:serine protease Do